MLKVKGTKKNSKHTGYYLKLRLKGSMVSLSASALVDSNNLRHAVTHPKVEA